MMGNGTAASPIAIDTAALAVKLSTAPLRDSIVSVVTNSIRVGNVNGQNLTAGSLLQTTGTPTGASLKAAGYQVDTAALKTFINGRTTNTLSSAVNTMTSTTNGVSATAPIVNSVSNTFVPATRLLTTTVNGVSSVAVSIPSVASSDSTLASNGLTLNGVTVELGGSLSSATTITTSATNTLALAGLQSGAASDSILVVNPATNALRRVSYERLKDPTLVVTTLAAYTVPSTVDIVIFRGTAASTFTLPSASANRGKVLRILNFAPSNSRINITLSPAPIIYSGAPDFTNATVSNQLTQYGSSAASTLGNTIEIVSDGTDWFKLGN